MLNLPIVIQTEFGGDGSTMADRSQDWLNQAIRDLEQAEDSRARGGDSICQ